MPTNERRRASSFGAPFTRAKCATLCVLAMLVGLGGPACAEDEPKPVPALTAAESAELARAGALDAQIESLFREGKYEDALPLAREVLSIRERVQGRDHLEVAYSTRNLAILLKRLRSHAEARTLYERVVAIHERALGLEHPDVARELNALAQHVLDLGAYGEARALHERALAIRERALGPEHPDVAQSLHNLGNCLMEQSAFVEARRVYERALAIRERALGPDHISVAVSLNGLGLLLDRLAAYPEARSLLERALAIRERAQGSDHPDVAVALNNLGQVLLSQGDLAGSRLLRERSLAIREKAFGTEHPKVAIALNNLAQVLTRQGAYAEARRHYERALGIYERALGPHHPDLAMCLDNYAVLLKSQGYYALARAQYERALAIHVRVRGPEHPAVATSLNSLGNLLHTQGAHAEARPMFERALAIRERALGPDHPEVAESISSLAISHMAQGDLDTARRLLERTLAIHQRAGREEHPDLATDLNNFGSILRVQGDAEGARTAFERALAIQEKVLGLDHPQVSTSLNNLASVLATLGAADEARRLFERSLRIMEAVVGSEHPYIATTHENLALLLARHGALDEARRHFERGLALVEAHVRRELAGLSASQRIQWVRTTRHRLDNWLQFAATANLTGYTEVLRFRGLVARAERAERAITRESSGTAQRALEPLRAAQARVATLAHAMPARRDSEARAAWKRMYAEALVDRERLALELAQGSAPYRAALARLDLTQAEIQTQLPPDTALVEFLRTKRGYVAWILHGTGDPVRVDLDEPDLLETACARFVRELSGTAAGEEGITLSVGADLRARLWAPVAARLGGGVRRVVVVPDAALAFVPFGALPGATPGTYLSDEVELSFVMHAFDIVPRKDAPAPGVGALVLGGIDYERATSLPADPSPPVRPAALALADRAPVDAKFPPLQGTASEAEELSVRLGKGETTLVLGSDATERRLRTAARGRRIVHVATHGFSRSDPFSGLYQRANDIELLDVDAERRLAEGHDPMLLSGLAMAGANARDGANGDDGILTALEASYIDLDGVQLVTLSACETAKGTAESGEGVLGLVSAFQMAGAERVIASLWKVDDEATRRLMDGMYERMLRPEAPLAPAEALRASAGDLRRWKDGLGKTPYAAPRFWAAFVAYGR